MKCPMCGEEAEQDVVDIGVGNIPCGPAYCERCQWVDESDDVEDED